MSYTAYSDYRELKPLNFVRPDVNVIINGRSRTMLKSPKTAFNENNYDKRGRNKMFAKVVRDEWGSKNNLTLDTPQTRH